jgi:hypothetical protein
MPRCGVTWGEPGARPQGCSLSSAADAGPGDDGAWVEARTCSVSCIQIGWSSQHRWPAVTRSRPSSEVKRTSTTGPKRPRSWSAHAFWAPSSLTRPTCRSTLADTRGTPATHSTVRASSVTVSVPSPRTATWPHCGGVRRRDCPAGHGVTPRRPRRSAPTPTSGRAPRTRPELPPLAWLPQFSRVRPTPSVHAIAGLALLVCQRHHDTFGCLNGIDESVREASGTFLVPRDVSTKLGNGLRVVTDVERQRCLAARSAAS